ncbi:hypothetical protein [Luteimonas vadosa]
MRSGFIQPLLACMLLAFSLPAMAQDAAAQGIERQMTTEEFKAAGLDKLSPAELARLNAWLNRTVETAAAEAKKRVEDDNRGFFSFGSSEPVVATIAGEFRGFARGREYTLDNGNVWKQVDEASLVGARLTNPEVKITPSMVGNSWYMQVGRYNTRAKVQRIK